MPALLVVDMFHGTTVTSFPDARNAGLVGIIHKASQGAGYTDPRYGERRGPARAAGLLWGAYHFATGDPVDAQIENFMNAAAPDGDTLIALDFEPNGAGGGTMSLSQARDFLGKLGNRLGRKPVFYSGALIKEQLGNTVDAFFGGHRMWLAQYGPTPKVQKSWQSYWLWQYSGDGFGPGPQTCAGIPGNAAGKIDCNTYAGSPGQLTAEWAS